MMAVMRFHHGVDYALDLPWVYACAALAAVLVAVEVGAAVLAWRRRRRKK